MLGNESPESHCNPTSRPFGLSDYVFLSVTPDVDASVHEIADQPEKLR